MCDFVAGWVGGCCGLVLGKLLFFFIKKNIFYIFHVKKYLLNFMLLFHWINKIFVIKSIRKRNFLVHLGLAVEFLRNVDLLCLLGSALDYRGKIDLICLVGHAVDF